MEEAGERNGLTAGAKTSVRPCTLTSFSPGRLHRRDSCHCCCGLIVGGRTKFNAKTVHTFCWSESKGGKKEEKKSAQPVVVEILFVCGWLVTVVIYFRSVSSLRERENFLVSGEF